MSRWVAMVGMISLVIFGLSARIITVATVAGIPCFSGRAAEPLNSELSAHVYVDMLDSNG